MKKTLLLMLSLLLLTAMVAACGAPAAPASDETAASEDAGSGDKLTPPGELPIVEEPVTLRVMLAQRPGVEDYDTNTYTLWLEEQTGIDLEFEVVPEADAQTKLNVVLASGDLPDIFMGMPFNDALLAQMGDEGVIMPLNDLIEEQGVEIKQMLDEERPHIKQLLYSPDGNIYGLPKINECYHCFFAQKMWIYQPWLDELGLDVPQTTEEFEAALKAFAEMDPNGNGEADEIPLTGSPNGWHTQIDRFLVNGFTYYDYLSSAQRMTVEDGVVSASFAQPEFRDALRYLSEMYDQGLIDPSAFTQDDEGLRTLVNNPDINIVGAFPAGWAGTYVQVDEEGELVNWSGVPALEGPDGFRQSAHAPWGFFNGSAVIPSSSEHPEVALRLLDLMYTYEGSMGNQIGQEGEDWEFVDDAEEKGIDGNPAVYKLAKPFSGELQNFRWNETGPIYRTAEDRLGEAASSSFTEVILYNTTADKYEPYGRPIEDLIPPLVVGADASRELSDVKLAVDSYVDEMITQFAIGGADINDDNHWEEYMATLEATGVERMVEIYQEAYDQRVSAGQ